MSDWKLINSSESLEIFLNEVDLFEDALVHEAILLNSGYVDTEGSMHGDTDRPNARVIIQSQFDNVAVVEMELIRVSIFNLKFSARLQMEGETLKEGVALYLCGKGSANNVQLRAKEIRYRMLGMDSRGPQFKYSCGLEAELIKEEEEPQDYPGAG